MSEGARGPVVLIIRDGWGENPHPEQDRFNAIKLASTPVDDRLRVAWPTTLIRTSGRDVGVPDGTMGNSEVGHQNIGAGRIVDQESVRISKAIESGAFFENEALRRSIGAARDSDGTVHLLCICSDSGVHGLLEHLYACVELCHRMEMPRVAVHLFTDGRDAGPFTGRGYIEQVERRLAAIGCGRIATLCGRYYAMDRDYHWERIRKAYDLLTGRADVPVFDSAAEALESFYDHPTGETLQGDEFVTPRRIGRATPVSSGDTVIFVNYRGDRPRQLTTAFVLDDFEGSVPQSASTGRRGFDRGERPKLSAFVTMTSYSEALEPLVEVAFKRHPKMQDILGEYVSGLGLRQFRCAETEKYAHVTFFFNDYREEPFEGERRQIIQSPRVATYDQRPEMSAAGVRDAVVQRLRADDCEDLIVVNFANCDMVGHTGNLEAARRACEVVDECVGRILDATLARRGKAIVTADHGNAEQMWDPETEAPHTAHTLYMVPLTVVGDGLESRSLREGGRLADIAPTALELLGLDRPEAMTGRSLLA
ncbi:MAG: 2,3-bisphosphoglycerate-independent phosphoglycerate mutase [Phycisphaerales bacterium JB039]